MLSPQWVPAHQLPSAGNCLDQSSKAIWQGYRYLNSRPLISLPSRLRELGQGLDSLGSLKNKGTGGWVAALDKSHYFLILCFIGENSHVLSKERVRVRRGGGAKTKGGKWVLIFSPLDLHPQPSIHSLEAVLKHPKSSARESENKTRMRDRNHASLSHSLASEREL